MYPHDELTRLAAHKAVLRRTITRQRVECAAAAARALRPLELLDRVMTLVRRFSPLALMAAVPVGLAIQRTAFPRLKLLGFLSRWGPPLFTAVRSLRTRRA